MPFAVGATDMKKVKNPARLLLRARIGAAVL